jgi:predicted Zn finger-like uncharacterized protein
MSLATRCTACGTVFRVVQDQLKVSEGWVRCGRCQEVFNALEGLFDLDRDASSAPTPAREAAEPIPHPAEPGPASAAATERLEPEVDAAAASAQTDTIVDSTPATAAPVVEAPAPAVGDSEMSDDGDFADARFNTALLADDEADEQGRLLDDAAPQTLLDEVADAPPAPSFVAEADRAARWRRPGVRIALMLGAAMLLALLALQVSLQFHDALAARWPALRVPMAALCEAAGCTVQPPRDIEAISVDSSGLTRASDIDAYRLSLVLRNRADFAVAPPSVELSVTDSNGALLARRVFAPTEFGAGLRALAPQAETALQLTLASSERISGYTIEIFYP